VGTAHSKQQSYEGYLLDNQHMQNHHVHQTLQRNRFMASRYQD